MALFIVLKYIIFSLIGTAGIIMAAPSHYDIRQPIDVKYSKIDKKNKMMMQMMHEELDKEKSLF